MDSPLVKAALDAVPDPINGLIYYPGQGGTALASVPRRPKPAPAAAAAELPEPGPSSRASHCAPAVPLSLPRAWVLCAGKPA